MLGFKVSFSELRHWGTSFLHNEILSYCLLELIFCYFQVSLWFIWETWWILLLSQSNSFFWLVEGRKDANPEQLLKSMDFLLCGLVIFILVNLAVSGWENHSNQWLELVSLCFSEHQNSTQVTPRDNLCRRAHNCCDLLVSSCWVTDSLWLQWYPFSTLNNLCVIVVLHCNKATAFWSLRWMMLLFIETESLKVINDHKV